MPFEKLHENHKRLWDWLAENPTMDKCDWPEWAENGGDTLGVCSDCFACEYDEIVSNRQMMMPNCSYCPIHWSGQRVGVNPKPHCNVPGSEFYTWDRSSDPDDRAEIARKIRDMPWINKDRSND